MRTIESLVAFSVLLLALLAPVAPATAQGNPGWDSNRLQYSRAELEELRQRLEAAASAPAYSGGFRAQAQQQAKLVAARLAEGDFQVGDQIAVVVEGEDSLSTNYVVRPGRVITLRTIGDVPLTGVLRSELETHLKTHLSRYIREPVVHARALFRVVVMGAVSRPGYYVVPAETLLSDAVMLAGGLAPEAQLNALRIDRQRTTIWGGEELQRLVAEGRTLDQLNLRAGDEIVVPSATAAAGGARRVFRGALAIIPTILVALTALTQL